MLPLTEKGDKSVIYVQKLCYICKNKFSSDIKTTIIILEYIEVRHILYEV